MDKKRTEFGSEPVSAARVIIVDPRRTVTVNACEVEAGKDRVMHLAINSGTDLALFNAWLTYMNDRGLIDKDFIAASTKDFDKAVAANKTTLEEAAQITGLSVDQIRQSAEWIAQPKQGGARRRTMFAYEKGLIWGNDNYRTNGALVNVALATGNIGRPGGGCVRMGGHQEGYSRPSDAHVGRPAAYVDKLPGPLLWCEPSFPAPFATTAGPSLAGGRHRCERGSARVRTRPGRPARSASACLGQHQSPTLRLVPYRRGQSGPAGANEPIFLNISWRTGRRSGSESNLPRLYECDARFMGNSHRTGGSKMKKLALSLMVLGVFGFTDAYAAAKTTKAKKPPTAAFAQAAAPKAPAKDPMCKVIVPDNQFGSHRDRYRCYR